MISCFSTMKTEREFIRAVQADPDRVFLSGRWEGRLMQLTLSTFLEMNSQLVVTGSGHPWRVHVERERAGRIITTAIRLPRSANSSSARSVKVR